MILSILGFGKTTDLIIAMILVFFRKTLIAKIKLANQAKSILGATKTRKSSLNPESGKLASQSD